MGKRIASELKEFAELLYMQGTPQNIIAEKVGVSKNTVNAWVTTGCWAEKKIAQSLTRKQVVNNILRSINNVAENLGNNKDITDIGGTSDWPSSPRRSRLSTRKYRPWIIWSAS